MERKGEGQCAEGEVAPLLATEVATHTTRHTETSPDLTVVLSSMPPIGCIQHYNPNVPRNPRPCRCRIILSIRDSKVRSIDRVQRQHDHTPNHPTRRRVVSTLQNMPFKAL